MSQEFLLTILANAPAEKWSAIKRAVRGTGPDFHEVWEKRFQRPGELNLGSIRVVGLGDGIHEEYGNWGAQDQARRIAFSVADQTRKRVLAAGAVRVTVTVQCLDDTPALTVDTNGEIDR
jgi:hypothetical protein